MSSTVLTVPNLRIDLELLRHHLRWLRVNGVSYERIAQLAGYRSPNHIRRIAQGEHDRVSPELYEAILHVRPTEGSDVGLVNSALTWRRVRSLQAVGWPANWIAEQLGMREGRLRISKPNTTVGVARAVATLVAEYGMQRGPSERARKHALRMGWKPHAYYDDNLQEFSDAG